MIIRVFSPFGSKRVEVQEFDSIQSLYEKIKSEFQVTDCQLSHKQNGDDPIACNAKYIGTIGLKHGDIVYLNVSSSRKTNNKIMDLDGDMKDTNHSINFTHKLLEEDNIDKVLSKMDGRIYRQRNEQYCRHGPSGKCIHCVPLEPYDENYLEHYDPPIQFMSFHAYLRKLSGGQHQGKFTTLENINCRIKSGCKEHLPWPEGICTKCQPTAITLSVQKYRHVDNIMFENKALMDDFLDYWRKTGCQRIGIMFGYYTTFDQAPLGIKAVVSAIYEPLQKSTRKSVELLNIDSSSNSNFLSTTVLDIAESLGLRPVGWIFTDLVSKDPKIGTVKHYRGTVDTYFLTAQECITAAYLQNLFPNICNLSSDGYFGSKFVTVVVTGDKDNQIHFEGYQVSNQCMALVNDDILIPTYDAPELGYIKEPSTTQYVPDVFCLMKDKYGNTVTKLGRPLPVEFLLVHMTVAFPKEELYSLSHRKISPIRFPIENRDNMGEVQNIVSLKKYMRDFTEHNLSYALSNLHLLWYLGNCETLLLKDGIKKLCHELSYLSNSKSNQHHSSSITTTSRKPSEDIITKFQTSKEWLSVLDMMQADPNSSNFASSPNGYEGKVASEKSPKNEFWSCIHCTFHNELSETSCVMCGLPH